MDIKLAQGCSRSFGKKKETAEMKKSALRKLSEYSASENSSKLVKIGEASQLIGVSIDTLRRWEKKGWLNVTKTPGGTRLYDREQIQKLNPHLKRGPKPLLTSFVKSVPAKAGTQFQKERGSASLETGADSLLDPRMREDDKQTYTQPQSNIFLPSDTSILSTLPNLSVQTNDEFDSMDDENKTLFHNLKKSLSSARSSIFTLVLTLLLVALITLPALVLTKYFNTDQKISAALDNPFLNGILETQNIAQGLLNIVSPRSSDKLASYFPTGSLPAGKAGPPGIFNKNQGEAEVPANAGIYANSGAQKLGSGDVLAESVVGSFLQINLDTEINGTASVSGTLTAPNIVYSITPGTNITVAGDPQNPTISATGLTELDTLATVTGRGATTTQNLTLSGTVTLGSVLNLGILTSDPSSATNGQTYYNSTSNQFRCYVNASWTNCDTQGSSATGVTSITGTSGQVIASASTGAVTLSLPQSISTSSDVEFASLTLSDLSTAGGIVYTDSAGLLNTSAAGTAGECLQSGGAGTPTWGSCGGGSSISGSGTINTISKFTAATTIGDSVLTDNGTTLTYSGTAGLLLSGSGADLTFANGETIDNDTNNQINLGLGASGTLLLTSTTTASITNSAGALNINAQSTGLNLQADGSIDVNIAGGNSATGCTITNSNGNLACSGNITGASTGTVGYWSRSGTTLTPATSNDIASISTNAATGGALSLTSSAISTTGSAGFNNTSTFTSTANGVSLYGINNTVSSTQALATTVGQSLYGNYTSLTKTGADTTSGTINLFGDYSTVSNTGGDTAGTRNTYAGYFSATGDTSGTTNAYGLYSTATGADNNYAGYFSTANTGQVYIDATLSGGARSADIFTITQANDATNNSTGNLIQLTQSDTDTTAPSMVISTAQTAGTGAALSISAASLGGGGQSAVSISSASGYGIEINSALAGVITGGYSTGAGISTTANSVSTGNSFNVTLTSTALTSGKQLNIAGAASGTLLSFTGDMIVANPTRTHSGATTITESGNYLDIQRANTNSGVGTTNITGDLVNFSSNCTQSSGTCTDNSDILQLTQSYASATGATLNIINGGAGQSIIAGNGTDLLQVNSTGDITFVDADSGSSITGSAGGALSIASANSQALNLTTTTAGNISLDPAGVGDINLVADNASGSFLNVAGLATGTAANALCQDSSANVITCTASSAAVSGTSGQIAFFNGASSVTSETSGFGWDTTNKLLTVVSTATTQTANSFSGTAFTTGELMDLTGTFSPADGSTNEAIDINITHSPTSSADNFQSLNLTTIDGTALGNTVYGLSNTLTLTGDAGKTGIGYYTDITSSSITGDTLVGFDAATTVTGILGGATTRNVYGVRSQPSVGAESTAGTTNVYGLYSGVSADVGAGGTVNAYGLYIANGTYDTDGTSTAYGINIQDISGADVNVDLNFSASPTVRIGDAGVLTFTEAGGNNTLCTITDSSNVGNLTCTGNITGASTGTAGYWSRASTTLSPATANDIVSIATTNTSGADLALTNTGVYTGTGIFNLTANSATTGTAETLSATGLTTGRVQSITATNTAASDTAVTQALYSLTNAQSTTANSAFTGLALNFTNNPSVAGNTEYAMRIQNQVTANSTDNAVAALLYLDNADTSAGGSTVVTNGLLIDNSGAISGGLTNGITIGSSTNSITTGLNLASTGITTDISLQNGETINNDVDGTIALTAASTTFSGDITVTGGDITGANSESLDIGEAANGTISLNIDGTTGLNVGSTGISSIGNVAHTIVNSSGALAIDSNSTGAINIGTGASAKTITVGNATGASALAFNSGTGSQTFTSQVVSGTTTTSGFVFDATALTTGTGSYFTSDSITQGKLMQIATTGNTLTTGTLADFRTTATSLTGTAGIGSLLNLDWSPGSATTATGDLFALNIGTNGTTTGSLFNILDTGSSIFSVKETAFETSLPSNFTAAGDVAVAYDLTFTNPTASYITSAAPLTLKAGETFNSSNLTLQTYNQGSVVFDIANTTTTGLSLSNSTLTTGTAFAIALSGTGQTSDTALSIAQTGITTGYTGSLINVSSTSTTGAATFFNLAANASTAGTLAALSGDALTTGIGLAIDNSTSAMTTGSLLRVTAGGTGAIATNGIVGITHAGAYTSTSNAGLLNVTATGLVGTGTVVNIGASNASQLTDTLLNVAQTGVTTGYTGTAISFSSTASTGVGANLLDLTASAMTVGTLLDINAGGITTGSALNIVGPSSTGVTGNFVNIATDVGSAGALMNLVPDFSGSAVTGYGLRIQGTDSTGNGNTNYGIHSTLTLTGNAAKTVAGIYQTITDTSTTGTTLYGADLLVDPNGVTGTGNKTIFGIRAQVTNDTPTDTNAATLYGGQFIATGNTGGTGSTSYGVYASASGSDNNYPFYSGVAFPNDGASTSALCWDNAGESAIYDCTTPLSDYAERYPVAGDVEFGEIITTSSNYVTDKTGVRVPQMVKAQGPYSNVIGVTSDNYSDFSSIGDNYDSSINIKPIALAGRVPVKVTMENGAIKRGDFVTSSSTPGKGMKSSRPGAVIGIALEDYSGPTDGAIQVFVKATYADPNDALAGLLLDDQGRMVASTDMDHLTVQSNLQVGGLVAAGGFMIDASKINLVGALASVPVSGGNVSLADTINTLNSQITQIAQTSQNQDSRILGLESSEASLSSQIAMNDERITNNELVAQNAIAQAQSLDQKVASTSANLASLSQSLTDLLASLNDGSEATDSGANNDERITINDLTPPTELLATDSATLANLDVTENLSSLRLSSLDATISGTLKSLGETFLGNTIVAGDFSIDGTLSVTGSSINSLACPVIPAEAGIQGNNSGSRIGSGMTDCGTLFVQNSPLASGVDFFNGLMTISKDGILTAKEVVADQFKVNAGTSAGTATLGAGQTEIWVPNTWVKSNSIIIITPESDTALPLIVKYKVADFGFTASITAPQANDIQFSYIIIGQEP